MFWLLQSFSLTACHSSRFVAIDKYTIKMQDYYSGGDSSYHFAFVKPTALGVDGCYTFSLCATAHNWDYIAVGFSSAIEQLDASIDDDFWCDCAYVVLGGQLRYGIGHDAPKVNDDDCLGRVPCSGDIITLLYNPDNGTLSAAFNLAPAILLRVDIPKIQFDKLRFFVALQDGGEEEELLSVTLVSNPRSSYRK